jgi:preprotein translocase subunit SecG
MQLVLVALHLVICLALIVIVLLQTGKGSEIGAVFGSSSQTLFGSTGGGTFFGKLTTGVAVVFLLTSLILAGRSSRVTSESVMSGVKPAATAPAPAERETPTEAMPKAEQATPAERSAETGNPAEAPAPEQKTTTPEESQTQPDKPQEQQGQ